MRLLVDSVSSLFRAAAAAILVAVTLHAEAQPANLKAQAVVDLDQDGIADATERALLARHTPMFRFTRDGGEEQYRPMDARQYVQWSELQASGDEGKSVLLKSAALLAQPALALTLGTDVTSTLRFRNDRFLNPLADVPKPGGNWARFGYAWADVLRLRNVGLYGHVVPLVVAPPQLDFLQCPSSPTPSDSDSDGVLCAMDSGRPPQRYFKVEYWQFFGYNGQGKPFDLGDHEGDWCSVQLIVTADGAIVQVHHFFHGRIAAYDLRKFPSFVPLESGRVREYRGPTFGKSVEPTWHSGPVADAQNRTSHANAQNHAVQLMADPQTGEFTHPVVYVENGGHEFWPTASWGFQDARSHAGNDAAHSYLATTPPNLGEVEHPLDETPDAALILRYNGHWGAFNRKNSPPQGPALHSNWLWPANSSIRWQLPKSMGY